MTIKPHPNQAINELRFVRADLQSKKSQIWELIGEAVDHHLHAQETGNDRSEVYYRGLIDGLQRAYSLPNGPIDFIENVRGVLPLGPPDLRLVRDNEAQKTNNDTE